MNVEEIDFNKITKQLTTKYFKTKESINELGVLLLYQTITTISKFDRYCEINKESKSYQTQSDDTKLSQMARRITEDLLDKWVIKPIEMINEESYQTIKDLRKKYNKLEVEKMLSDQESTNIKKKIEEIQITHKILKEENEKETLLKYDKRQSKKCFKKIGIKISKKMTAAEIVLTFNNIFKKCYQKAIEMRTSLNQKDNQISTMMNKLDIYEKSLEDFPNNQFYLEYEKERINQVKQSILNICNERENEFQLLVEKLEFKFDLVKQRLLEYCEYIEQKEYNILTIIESIKNTEIIPTFEAKVKSNFQHILEKINKLKKERDRAYEAMEKMSDDVEEMQQETSREYLFFEMKLDQLFMKDKLCDYYNYIKYRKYHATKDSKMIKTHLLNNCCKKNNNENLAGYKITPTIMTLLRKSGLDKVVLFDIKNCCNDIEKIILKALAKIRKYHGGKSSIWYRNFIADKYNNYNKSDINNKFYYTFLSDKITNENIKYDDFINDKNKKLTYFKYYRKLDKEANLKIAMNLLNKQEQETINNQNHKKLIQITERYLKMHFKEGFKTKTKEDIKNEIKLQKIYKKNKHTKIKRSRIIKKIEKEGMIKKADIMNYLEKKEKSGEIIPYIEKVGYDLVDYDETMTNLQLAISAYKEYDLLSETGMHNLLGGYKNIIDDRIQELPVLENITNESWFDD